MPTLYYYSAPDRGAEYCEVRVCLSVYLCVFVCPRSYLRNYTSDLHQIFVHVAYRSGSVLWWRSDTLYRPTSGFIDDVIFTRKPRLRQGNAKPRLHTRRRRPAEAQCTRSLGLGYKLCAVVPVAGQRTHGTTFRALKLTS